MFQPELCYNLYSGRGRSDLFPVRTWTDALWLAGGRVTFLPEAEGWRQRQPGKECVAQSFLTAEDEGAGFKSVWLTNNWTTNVPNTPGLKNPEYAALDSNLLVLSSWESMNKATMVWGRRESFL